MDPKPPLEPPTPAQRLIRTEPAALVLVLALAVLLFALILTRAARLSPPLPATQAVGVR